MFYKNPFKIDTHKVFKRTFLQEVQADIKFAEVNVVEDYEKQVQQFLYDIFIVNTPSEFSGIQLSSNTEQLKYNFDTRSAKVIIGPKTYKSFENTLLPSIDKLKQYVERVIVAPKVLEVSISKYNVLPIHTTDFKRDFKNILEHVIRKEHIEDIINIDIQDNTKISKEAVVDLGNGANQKIRITISLVDKNNIFIEFAFIATATDVALKDYIEIYEFLNETIYGAFINLVTNNILELMERD